MMVQGDLTPLRGQRVVVAMSGGVDSSVAAALLKEAGVETVGVFLHVWDYQRSDAARHGSCCALEDAYDARRVADRLAIPFYSLDMREIFRHEVIEPFIADYAAGRTPNPCALCNRQVKFGALLRIADQLGAASVATGHYLERRDDAEGVRLFRGHDRRKDQSYFLANLNRGQAGRLLFPVGHIEKEQTRRFALAFGLPTASKHESQDICFIPDGDRLGFLRREGGGGLQPGAIVDGGGRKLGEHRGIACYTLGQRKGLGLAGGPWQVVQLDGERAEVVVAPAGSARHHDVEIDSLCWIRAPAADEPLQARLRYASEPADCTVRWAGEGALLQFADPAPGTAPGQVAALYSGDELLGGGFVSRIV